MIVAHGKRKVPSKLAVIARVNTSAESPRMKYRFRRTPPMSAPAIGDAVLEAGVVILPPDPVGCQ